MIGRVLYVGRDPDLPAFLSLYGSGSFQVTAILPEKYRGEAADLLLWDLDCAPLPTDLPAGGRVVTVGYRADASLPRPFPYSDFETLLAPAGGAAQTVLSGVGRDLYSGSSRIRLSALEYDLYSLLSGVAAAVPTDALRRVGGRDLSPHALCVAISSLRKKLDRLPNAPLIRAVRGEGYRLIP